MVYAVVDNGKVNGKRIIRAWESFFGWYWLATEKVEDRISLINGKPTKDTIYFGFVIGICPEWGYFSEAELRSLSPLVWEVKKSDIPFITKEVK